MAAYALGQARETRDGKILHEFGFLPLDGDMARVVPADMSDDGGFPVDEFGINTGRWVDPTHAPTKLRFKARAGQQPLDFNPFLKGGFLVSGAFRALLEELEAGKHQFLPVTVFRKDKQIGEMFILVVGARIDASNDALCRPQREDRRTYLLPDGKTEWRMVLHPDKIAGHHLWHDKHRRGLYASQTLAEALEDAKLEGYKLGAPIEVSAG